MRWLANGRAFDGAVEKLRAYPALDVGVHLALVEERPLSDPERLRSLVDRQGRLPRTWAGLLGRLEARRCAVQEAERECRAQIERVLAAELRPSHLDSHQHVHSFPPLWRLVVRLAKDYHIPWVRGLRGAWRPMRPFDSRHGLWPWARSGFRPTGESEGATGSARGAPLAPGGWRRLLCRWPFVATACAMAWRNRRDRDTVRTEAMTLGVLESGDLTETVLQRLLVSLPHGVTELLCHPGYLSEELTVEYAHWGYQWPAELAALTSDGGRAALRERGVRLTTFRALSGSPHEDLAGIARLSS